jgi:hypothetical protein
VTSPKIQHSRQIFLKILPFLHCLGFGDALEGMTLVEAHKLGAQLVIQ